MRNISTLSTQEILGYILRMTATVENHEYYSYDLYDSLSGKYLNTSFIKNQLLKRIIIQLGARCPINLRPLIGVQKMVHTKTISDMISSYFLLYEITKNTQYLQKTRFLTTELVTRAIKTENYISWGLNFPYVTRFTNARVNTPNLYNTLHAAFSLLDYYNHFENEEVKHHLLSVVNYINFSFGVVWESSETCWIRYYPNLNIPFLNVNAIAANFFIRLNSAFNEEIVDQVQIQGLLNFLQINQNHDGSWYYSCTPEGKWIDGFHTGFILESLSNISLLSSFFDVDNMLSKGIIFFKQNLLTKDGIPKFYSNKLFPIEAQNCAQAIQTLAKITNIKHENDIDLLANVISNVLFFLYNSSKGIIYLKKNRLFTNKIIYYRWSQTPMILALLNSVKIMK